MKPVQTRAVEFFKINELNDSCDESQHGGTADISVHELKPDGTLKEIHKTSGGAWGGTEVDSNYINMMANLIGKDAMERYKKYQMGDYCDMLREFEVKKRTITSNKQGKIIFKIAMSLRAICEESGRAFKDFIAQSGLSSQIIITGDKLRIDAALVKDWFQPPIQCLLDHIKGIFKDKAMEKVVTIALVWGFGESQMVREAFQTNLQNKRIITPNDAGLVVLKGAVKFGHMPTVISTRILKYTYGRSASVAFDATIHPQSKLEMDENCTKWVCDVFDVIATVGESVDIGQTFVSRHLRPFNVSDTRIHLRIYSSDVAEPVYVSDSVCQVLGNMRIDLPDGNLLEDKRFDLMYIFGDTELIVKAKLQKTGQEFRTSIDCL